MKVSTYLDLQKQYEFNDDELNCIFLFLSVGNQEIAYAGTIGKKKKNKSLQRAGNYFFNKIEVKKFIHEQKDNIFKSEGRTIDAKKPANDKQEQNTQTKSTFEFPGDTKELTKENIKQVLEDEFSKITDPEKRTALLIRIADLLSLQNSNSNEVEKPVIYLPEIHPENS